MSTHEQLPAPDIRPCTRAELALINAAMPPAAMPDTHAQRLTVQERGDGVYLFAWLERQPVGHVLLRWHGSSDGPAATRFHGVAHLEALAVLPSLQSQGLGTRLMASAERMVLDRGQHRIGLAVGIGNHRAMQLYERLGYQDSGLATFPISWSYLDQNGKVQSEGEVCKYLVKSLT